MVKLLRSLLFICLFLFLFGYTKSQTPQLCAINAGSMLTLANLGNVSKNNTLLHVNAFYNSSFFVEKTRFMFHAPLVFPSVSFVNTYVGAFQITESANGHLRKRTNFCP